MALLLATLRRSTSLNKVSVWPSLSSRHAANRLTHVPAGWRVAAPSAADTDVVEQQQLGHPANMVGVPALSLCRHGYPQAVLQDPGAHKFGAGMLRLTCPHLCEAVDAWEAEGGVRELSSDLLKEEATQMSLKGVNDRHAATRRSMVQGEALIRAEARLGKDNVRLILKSGIMGLNAKLDDVKCLHAQLADELLSKDNTIGHAVLAGLEARGVDVAGSDVCGEQCSGCAGGWRYTPRKNKQKLRTARSRHKKMRELSLAGYATSLGPGRPLPRAEAAALEDLGAC